MTRSSGMASRSVGIIPRRIAEPEHVLRRLVLTAAGSTAGIGVPVRAVERVGQRLIVVERGAIVTLRKRPTLSWVFDEHRQAQ